MLSGGFAGRVLEVNLTTRMTRSLPVDPQAATRHLGGLGMTLRLYRDHAHPGAGALEPDNPVVLGAGPLVGTDLPSTSRVFAVSRLPASGTVGWCGAGGMRFGAFLKNAGFDHVLLRGAADRPVCLDIRDEEVTLRDAGDLWGQGIERTSSRLRGAPDPGTGVLCIGPGGESRVVFSMAYLDGVSTLGRGGLGAVLGAKNLKAVTVRGAGGVRVASPGRYRALRRELLEAIRTYPHLEAWQRLGMLNAFPLVPHETYARIFERRLACVSCPIGCKDRVIIPDGPHRGFRASSSSAVNLLTPLAYGFEDPYEAIRLVAELDDLGLDMFEFFGVVRFAASLVREGVLRPAEGDPPLQTDTLDSMLAWARRVADRRGSGDLLAGGFPALLERFGEQAATLAPALIRGMHPYTGPGSALPWDLFGTMELGQALDPRGPHVGSGGSPTYFARRPLEVFPRHLQRMGVPEEAVPRILPPDLEGSDKTEERLRVGRLLKHAHCWFAILGSLGICARGQINRFYSAELCAELYTAVTGIPADAPALHRRAARVWTLYRTLNLDEREASSGPEALPDPWFQAPGFRGYVGGQPLSRAEAAAMIRDYYDEWGWDPETGRPPPDALG